MSPLQYRRCAHGLPHRVWSTVMVRSAGLSRLMTASCKYNQRNIETMWPPRGRIHSQQFKHDEFARDTTASPSSHRAITLCRSTQPIQRIPSCPRIPPPSRPPPPHPGRITLFRIFVYRHCVVVIQRFRRSRGAALGTRCRSPTARRRVLRCVCCA